jgi:hypothetical protein
MKDPELDLKVQKYVLEMSGIFNPERIASTAVENKDIPEVIN